MGTDATLVVEMEDKVSGTWHMLCGVLLNRNYNLFDILREEGTVGYPANIDYWSRIWLEDREDWGEAHMSLERFYELTKGVTTELDFIRKKIRKNCRVIYRFDN